MPQANDPLGLIACVPLGPSAEIVKADDAGGVVRRTASRLG